MRVSRDSVHWTTRSGSAGLCATYGCALLGTADPAGAANAFREALGCSRRAGRQRDGLLLSDFAEVAMAEGDALRAARLKGAAAATRHVTEAEAANPRTIRRGWPKCLRRGD